MRKIILVFIFIGFALNALSQDHVPTKAELNDFFDTKTYIVMASNPISPYNAKIKEAVKNNWDITDYEFIEYSEFEKNKTNPDYSFLMDNLVVFEKDKTRARYRFLSIKNGARTQRMEEMPTICAFPLSYREVDEEYWAYKLGVIIQFMQDHVRTMKDNPEIMEGGLFEDNIFEYYHKNLEDIKDKTLYLIKDELAEEVNTAKEIEDVYPYDFKLVSREELEQAIEDQREDVVFLHKVGPQDSRYRARCYKILLGANDAKLYYFKHHTIKQGRRPDGFLERDFRRIERKVEGGLFGL